jgi:hypothetical protein
MGLISYSDFKFENDPTIMESSRVVIESGCTIRRVVLRQKDGEYITHMENLSLEGDTFKHGSFYYGHYFDSNMTEALRDFHDRCEKL